MSWDQTDQLVLRTFLGTPTGQKLIPHLIANRPPSVPKEFRDPKAIGGVDNMPMLAAYSYKGQGWEECVEFIRDLGVTPEPETVAAFDYSSPNYTFEHGEEVNNTL
jgi:hypothetical protein